MGPPYPLPERSLSFAAVVFDIVSAAGGGRVCARAIQTQLKLTEEIMSSVCLCGGGDGGDGHVERLNTRPGTMNNEEKDGNFVPAVELSLASRTLKTPAAQHTNESKYTCFSWSLTFVSIRMSV